MQIQDQSEPDETLAAPACQCLQQHGLNFSRQLFQLLPNPAKSCHVSLSLREEKYVRTQTLLSDEDLLHSVFISTKFHYPLKLLQHSFDIKTYKNIECKQEFSWNTTIHTPYITDF